MRPLKLHTKTALLASAVTVAVFIATLMGFSVRVANRVREEQKELAELKAISLAEHISNMPSPRDSEALARAATLVRGGRPGIVSVRVWERAGGVFIERAEAAGSAPAEEIPEETKAALRSGLESKIAAARPNGANDSLYRAFAPTTEQGRMSGAVEVVEQLEDPASIALRYARSTVWMVIVALVLMTLATYLLFRGLIYRPIERLLAAMSRAKSGDLSAEAPPRPPDEIGLLSREFNSMLAQVREMTKEREAQQLILQQRVSEATSELEQRNEQLEETNLELWRTTRRLTELERLAAAGQTAAQFAHEVGTPLNLISGHVQLLRAGLSDERAGLRLSTISEQIERIERIVRRMLDRTRPQAVELTPLDLNNLLQRIFDATAPALEERKVELTANLAPELPQINGDTDRLQQVFINLINNALDAMPDGGELRVSTSVLKETDGARAIAVDFVDTGHGMTPETRARIFDPLYTTKARGRGTGLGLMVVSQVVSDHGGQIEVESEPERGARFCLKFPAIEESEQQQSEVVLARQGVQVSD